MTDQPVTPDREALIEVLMRTPFIRSGRGWDDPTRDECRAVVDALLPLLTEALDRGRQQGWRDHWEYVIRGGGSDLGEPGDLDQLRAELGQVKAATRFADLVELVTERDAALALLRQVQDLAARRFTTEGELRWGIRKLIDESHLLDDEGQQQ